MNYDIVVIGGGPAGMSAAISAKQKQDKRVLLIEREEMLGGTLNQCIHCGFGKNIFSEPISGSEYAQYFIEQIEDLNIEVKLNTMVLVVNKDKTISYVNPEEGMKEIKAKSIILATGSREKFNGNVNIPLNKFTGIYTLGTAHKFVNFKGYLPGKNIVIAGLSDMAIIIARRLIIEGANIQAIIDTKNSIEIISDYSKKIIEDFGIVIKSGFAIHEVKGSERIEGVVLNKMTDKTYENDENSLEEMTCDSLLISVGWLPENELISKCNLDINKRTFGIKVNANYQTSQEGIFACGNLVHCYGLADVCNQEGTIAGDRAFEYIMKIQ